MLEMVFWVIVFIVSLAVLIKASSIFTDAAEEVGLFFGMSSFIIGVTIVAFGTSLPELISGFISVYYGAPEIIIGNVLGANISNILLILGLAAIVSKKIRLTRELLNIDLPIMVAAAFLGALIVFDGIITLPESLLLIVFFIVYLFYTISTDNKIEEKKKAKKKVLRKRVVLYLCLGAVLIYFGAEYTIQSVIHLSEIFNIGTGIIAATIFSFGTTLPELTVSLTAARKGNAEIAIGNIIGSNIFNILAVIGFPALMGTVLFGAIVFNVPMFLIAVLLGATVLFFFITQDKEVTRWEGYILIIFYIFFITKMLGLI